MTNYEEARVTLAKSQQNILKSGEKSKAETTLRITKKSFQDEELS